MQKILNINIIFRVIYTPVLSSSRSDGGESRGERRGERPITLATRRTTKGTDVEFVLYRFFSIIVEALVPLSNSSLRLNKDLLQFFFSSHTQALVFLLARLKIHFCRECELDFARVESGKWADFHPKRLTFFVLEMARMRRKEKFWSTLVS